MATQLSLQLSNRIFSSVKVYANKHGFDTVQDFIRELIRERIFENEAIGGEFTSRASEESLSRYWMTKEEDQAWSHLQKET